MATATFFDVKTRSKVEVEVTGKKSYTVNGQPRYALRGKTTDGRNLTKFVKKDVYDSMDVPTL